MLTPVEAAGQPVSYIPVSPEVLEELDFAQCALGQNLLAKNIGDFLDGDTFVGLVVHRGAVEAERVSMCGCC